MRILLELSIVNCEIGKKKAGFPDFSENPARYRIDDI
jgi:hypothetical protein